MCIEDWTWTFSRIKTRSSALIKKKKEKKKRQGAQHKAYAISAFTCQEDNDNK